MASRSFARSAASSCVLTAAVVFSTKAAADGAFPDAFQPLLPISRSHDVLLATNFGLVHSADDGMTWDWICEQAIFFGVSTYQLGPPPIDAVYAVGFSAFAFSRDSGCTWSFTTGVALNYSFLDVFPDPTDSLHLLAIAKSSTTGAVPALYESDDGGRTFDGPIYRTANGNVLSGVELARSDPRTIYVTVIKPRPQVHSMIARSTDGGRTFEEHDLSLTLTATTPRFFIAAVDPVDARKVYFRARGRSSEALFVTEDGGETMNPVLRIENGGMSAFLRRPNGTILVGKAIVAGGYRSDDGGRTFSDWNVPLHLRGLAERDGVLFASADGIADGFSLGVSRDDGASWEPVLGFEQIQGPRSDCPDVVTNCTVPWGFLMDSLGIGTPSAPDAGRRVDAGPAPSGSDAGTEPPPDSKCGCSQAGGGAASGPGALAMALLFLAAEVLRVCGPVRARRARSRSKWVLQARDTLARVISRARRTGT